MKMDPVIFREYDIRGVYNEQFDLVFAMNLGRALVTYISKKTSQKKPKITLGYDARLSSPDITRALSEGIRKSGGNVVLLGLVTTPICYFSTFELENIDGAFMVTGSHNPPEYNGFKVSVGKTTIFGDDIQELFRIMEAQDYLNGDGQESSVDIMPLYLERYKKEFDSLSGIPVVLDCANGAAGCVVRKLYESLDIQTEILFEEPDGTFPNHHPDPTVAKNLVDLIKRVKETGAKVGIGFDGDADRIGVVDEKGRIIYGDELMVLFSRFILKENPGAPIIGDVKCSDRLYEDIEKHGGRPIMWLTGHSLIKEKVKLEKSPFGGELSGHIFFADRNYGYDDAPYAGLRIVEILHKTGKTLSEILDDYPTAFNTPEIRIDTTEEKKHSIVSALKERFKDGSDEYSVNLIDGIRISYKDGWALARASNTQPVLVLRFESSTQEGLDRIQSHIESVVKPLL